MKLEFNSTTAQDRNDRIPTYIVILTVDNSVDVTILYTYNCINIQTESRQSSAKVNVPSSIKLPDDGGSDL